MHVHMLHIHTVSQEEYLSALSQGQWNRRVEMSGGEAVIMHSQLAIVHYPSQPHDSIVSDDLSHPRSVLRGFAEVDKVDTGEKRKGLRQLYCTCTCMCTIVYTESGDTVQLKSGPTVCTLGHCFVAC